MKLFFNGGLNEQQTPTLFECIQGYNFELGLRQSKLVPRRPYDLVGTATNALAINGFIQLVKRDNSETTLVQAGDTVYEWNGAGTFTSRGSVDSDSKLRGVTWSLGDYSVIVDVEKQTVVKKWDGSSLTTLTTGLGTDLYAKYGVVHLGRVWLANVTTTTDTPHLIAASRFEDPTSFDVAQRAVSGTFSSVAPAFYLLSPDLRPINGMKLFQDQLIFSTEGGRLFKLTGTSPTDFALEDFYAGSAATGDESMENIGNDVIFMKSGGNIDLLSATEKFGDVSADDVSRWIPDTVENLTGSITVYDQIRQKILFFVSGKIRSEDFYAGSAATGDESMENIGNDVIFMKSGGNIDLLSATEKFGDVSADDVSRWIPDTVENLTGSITVYDQIRQKILFFVSGKILVLFKDLIGGELSPWSVYKTQEAFAFNTNAAAYIKRPGTQQYSVFFGDEVGRIFDLNGSVGGGDAGTEDVVVLRKTRFIQNGEGGDRFGRNALDFTRKVLSGVVVYRRVSMPCDVSLTFDWGDEYNESTSVVTLKGAPTVDNPAYYSGMHYYSGAGSYYSIGNRFAQKISSQA